MAEVGKVYLVGGGPGDPGLLTLKAKRCLEIADVVLYDGLVNPLLLRHTKATAERTNRVGLGPEKRLDQDEINKRLVDAAKAGKIVVRLKGGDPYIFGRGSEEALALAEAGIPFEVVPGITAATAAAAYSGVSLTHRKLASAVAFITGHEAPTKPQSALDYEQLVKFPGTLVFYMGLHRLPEIAKSLIASGMDPETSTLVISKASTPLQQSVHASLEDIGEKVAQANLQAPSLIVVGECTRQREQINWFETLPLIGQTIGIARPEHQTDEVIDQAIQLGAAPILMPAIKTSPLSDWTEVDQVIETLEEFDWIVFTSVNGVDAFLGRLWELGSDARRFGKMKIACIGPATAKRLEEYSIRPDLVPPVYKGEELADAMKPHVEGKSVLWARANRGREVIPETLISAGAEFRSLVVYQHLDVPSFPNAAIDALHRGKLDWIALSSPTIARNVAERIQELSLNQLPKFAAISPVTQEAAEQAGLTIKAVAQEFTWPGLFQAIVEWQQNHK
ncbi:uroporphyrinogen-III C-methyltransferase [Thalassoglobus sp. JC818]|uniref:uroporphyrinogen-III C-methyltransferase n=1 Tax=Thalassoglobus sp. JC818 TaxID=3232136 RepID=UPI0034587DC5